MTAPEATSTRPYLLRALMEWCTDNGFTPHIAVRVDRNTQVPMEFVRDGQIVLNISYDATSGLLIGNDYVQFTARFGGKPREIMVPVANVMAIYARETGQGMAFRRRTKSWMKLLKSNPKSWRPRWMRKTLLKTVWCSWSQRRPRTMAQMTISPYSTSRRWPPCAEAGQVRQQARQAGICK